MLVKNKKEKRKERRKTNVKDTKAFKSAVCSIFFNDSSTKSTAFTSCFRTFSLIFCRERTNGKKGVREGGRERIRKGGRDF